MSEPHTLADLVIKDDAEKVRFDLICPLAELALAMVLTSGAKKYEPFGWQKYRDAQWRVDAAIGRHHNAIRRGDRIDPEFNLPHSVHLLANAMFLASFELEEMLENGEFAEAVRLWDHEMRRASPSSEAHDNQKCKQDPHTRTIYTHFGSEKEDPAPSDDVAELRLPGEQALSSGVFNETGRCSPR